MQANALSACVARVIDAEERTRGTGFLVRPDLAVTCIHVVERAGAGPGDRVRLAFHAGGEPVEAEALPDGYHPQADVAFLRPIGPLPEGVHPASLGPSERSNGHLYQALGYPLDGPVEARWAQGRIGGPVLVEGYTFPLLQLQGSEVDRGLSGAPVLDLETGQVVGMLTGYRDVERPRGAPEVRFAYAIPAEALHDLRPAAVTLLPWPEEAILDAYCIPLPQADVFIGREREKNEFRRALEGVLQKMANREGGPDWAQVFFIWGEGGIGKSSLLGEYGKMCAEHNDQLFWLYIDCERISSEAGTPGMMGLIRDYLKKKYQVNFPRFHEVEINRSRVLGKVYDLRASFTGKSEAEFNQYLRDCLSEREYFLYNQPQRMYSEAFVHDLCQIAQERPIVLMFDSYETVWHFADEWMRGGLYRYCLGDQRVGRRFIIVVAGRLSEEVESRHRDAVRRYAYHLAYFHKTLDKFTEDDIRDYLSQVVPNQPLSDEVVSRIQMITRGIPLAVSEIAAIIRAKGDVNQMFSDIESSPAEHQVISLVTQRFLKYCLEKQTPERDRDRDCIYTLAIVRKGKTVESDSVITMHRWKFLRDIWFKCGLIKDTDEFYRTREYLLREYSFLFTSGNMHSDVQFFMRKALRQGSVEPGRLEQLNETAKAICEKRLKERIRELEAQHGIERAEREKYRDSQWQEWFLDWVNHSLWLGEYEDVTRTIINEYIMAMQYSSGGFHRRLLNFIKDDELLYNALPPHCKKPIDRLSDLREWFDSFKMSAEREELLGFLEEKPRVIALLLAAKRSIEEDDFETARQRISEAEQRYRTREQRDATIESDLAAAYQLLGRKLARSSKRRQVQQESLDILKKAQNWSPENPHIFCALGNVLVNLLRIEEARLNFEKALDLSGRTSTEARQGLERIRHLRETGSFHPRKEARILTAEGNALSARGEFDEAKRMYKTAMESDPSYIPAYVKLSQLLRYEGDLEKGLEVLKKIDINRVSENYLKATIYDAYGALYLLLEILDKAVESYLTAISLSPSYINSFNGLGRAYVRLGRAQDAIEQFKQALEVKRRSAIPLRASLFWVYNGLGMAYLLADQPNGAEECFQIAAFMCERHLENESRRYYTLAHLGIALFGQQRYGESLDAFKRFAAILRAPGLLREILCDLQLISKYNKRAGQQEVLAFVASLL